MKLRDLANTTINMSTTQSLMLLANTNLARSIESSINSLPGNRKIKFYDLDNGNSFVNASILTDQYYNTKVVTSQNLDTIDVITYSDLELMIPPDPDSGNVGNVSV